MQAMCLPVFSCWSIGCSARRMLTTGSCSHGLPSFPLLLDQLLISQTRMIETQTAETLVSETLQHEIHWLQLILQIIKTPILPVLRESLDLQVWAAPSWGPLIHAWENPASTVHMRHRGRSLEKRILNSKNTNGKLVLQVGSCFLLSLFRIFYTPFLYNTEYYRFKQNIN